MKEIEFRGLKGLLLEDSRFKIVILPELGGKIASFIQKETGFELLFQNREETYQLPEKNGIFSEYDTSGFDDCFPNIVLGDVAYGDKKVTYPDHGEIWFSKFSYEQIDSKLVLTYKSDLMEYTYIKTFSLGESGLDIGFDITNTGRANIDCFYTVHCLTNCEDGMKIIFPDCVKEILNVSTASTVLGEYKSVHPYPITKDLKGNSYSLDRIAGPEAKKCEKYYATDRVETGKCGIFYPSINAYFTMTYDEAKLPYLGLWVNENGFNGSYNCALEPSNGFHDSMVNAYENNKYYIIKSNETFSFNIAMDIRTNY